MFLFVEKVRVPRAFMVAVLAALGWLTFYASWLLVAPGGEHGLMVFADTAYLVPIAAAAVLSVWAARRAVRGMRVFWGIVAASNALWLGAEVLWSVRELGSDSIPFPWWTDVGYLASYALLLAAIAVAFRPSFRTVRLAGVLDGAIVVGALALVWWWIVLRPLSLGADPVSVVGVAYPSFGLALLGMLAATRLLPARRGTLALKLFGVAILATAVADGVYTSAAVTHTYLSGDWIAIGWQAEACLLSLAALATVLGLDRRSDWARWRPAASLAPAGILTGSGIALLVVLVADTWGGGPPSTGTLIACGGLALLTAARLALAGVRAQRFLESGVRDASYLLYELRRQVTSARYFGESFALALVEPTEREALESGASSHVARAAREVDVVAKLEDGRLCVLMPRVGAPEAQVLAERVRAASGEERASVGVVIWHPGDSADDLLELAERLVETARRLGGNIVCGPESDVLFDPAQPAESRRRQLGTLVASLDARGGVDPEHSARVAALARSLAVELALEPEDAEAAELAGLLHALGKASVPDAELAHDPRNALHSAELVSRIPAARHAAAIVAAQHEHWDGSGAPWGLVGAAIPLGARVLAVAHEVVSLLEGTRHGAPFSLTSALTEVWRHTDGRFDPAVASALLRLVREGRLEGLPETVAAPALALAL